jgi:hypothetical protein
MKTYFGVLMVLFFGVSVSLAKMPSAMEVLEKFAETQDTFRSFITKSESEIFKTGTGFNICDATYTEFSECRFVQFTLNQYTGI